MDLAQLLIVCIIFSSIFTIIFYLAIKFLQGHHFKNRILRRQRDINKKYYDWLLNHQWFFIIFALILILIIFTKGYLFN